MRKTAAAAAVANGSRQSHRSYVLEADLRLIMIITVNAKNNRIKAARKNEESD